MKVKPALRVLLDRAWVRSPDWQQKLRLRPRSRSRWPDGAFLIATAARELPGEPLRSAPARCCPRCCPGSGRSTCGCSTRTIAPPTTADGCGRSRQAGSAAAGRPKRAGAAVAAPLLQAAAAAGRLPAARPARPDGGRLAAARDGGFSLILASDPARAGRSVRRRTAASAAAAERTDRRWRLHPASRSSRSTATCQLRFTGRGDPDRRRPHPDGGGPPRGRLRLPRPLRRPRHTATVQQAATATPTVAARLRRVSTSQRARTVRRTRCDALLAELDQLAALYLRLLDCHRADPGRRATAPSTRCTLPPPTPTRSCTPSGSTLPLAHSDLPDPVHAARDGGVLRRRLRHRRPAQPTCRQPTSTSPATTPSPPTSPAPSTCCAPPSSNNVAEDPAELEQLLATSPPNGCSTTGSSGGGSAAPSAWFEPGGATHPPHPAREDPAAACN